MSEARAKLSMKKAAALQRTAASSVAVTKDLITFCLKVALSKCPGLIHCGYSMYILCIILLLNAIQKHFIIVEDSIQACKRNVD